MYNKEFSHCILYTQCTIRVQTLFLIKEPVQNTEIEFEELYTKTKPVRVTIEIYSRQLKITVTGIWRSNQNRNENSRQTCRTTFSQLVTVQTSSQI